MSRRMQFSLANQYKQILRTYWQRPLIQLLALGFLSCFLFLLFGNTDGDVTQIGARPQRRGKIHRVFTDSDILASVERTGLETIPTLLERLKPEEVYSLNLTRLNVDDPLPDLSMFQQLVYLDLGGFDLTSEDVDRICELPKLDSLILTQDKLPEGALRRFGQKVSQLELLALTLEAHPDEIEQMTNVKLLSLHIFNASPKLIVHATQVPHLQQLTLLSPQNLVDLNDQQLALLRNHPTLKDVYANWFNMQHAKNFQVSDLLPVRALPITYSKNKLRAISASVFAMAMLFSILSTQLWGHFISPAATVVPNYLVPHRRVAVGIFVSGVLLLLLALLRFDFGILPSLCLVLLIPAFFSVFSVAQLSRKTYLQWMLFPVFLSFLLFSPMLSEVIFNGVAGDVVWFLQGQMPVASTIMILIQILCISWSLTKLPAITSRANETYLTTPAFSPWDTERLKQTQWTRNNAPFLRMIDRGTSGLRYRGGSTLHMVHLWRQGNMFRPILILLLLLLMVCFGLLIHLVRSIVLGEELFAQDFRWMSGIFAGPAGVGIILPVLVWWQRRKSMEVESLRPIRRNTLVKQLYLSLAVDHWLAVICLLGLVAMRAFEAPGGRKEIIGLTLFLGIAAPLWMLGVNATVLAFKQTWVIVGSMIGLYAFVVIALSTAAIWVGDVPAGSDQDMQSLVVFALCAIAVAIGLNVLMYRTALRREWG